MKHLRKEDRPNKTTYMKFTNSSFIIMRLLLILCAIIIFTVCIMIAFSQKQNEEDKIIFGIERTDENKELNNEMEEVEDELDEFSQTLSEIRGKQESSFESISTDLQDLTQQVDDIRRKITRIKTQLEIVEEAKDEFKKPFYDRANETIKKFSSDFSNYDIEALRDKAFVMLNVINGNVEKYKKDLENQLIILRAKRTENSDSILLNDAIQRAEELMQSYEDIIYLNNLVLDSVNENLNKLNDNLSELSDEYQMQMDRAKEILENIESSE